jgi:predicted Fe-Mo cluster-binding NifX family protein
MKIALSIAENRIAPLFDVADDCLLFSFTNGELTPVGSLNLTGICGPVRIFRIAETQADYLICGAISRQYQLMAEAAGLVIIGFLSGETEEVLEAFCQDSEPGMSKFRMPGCSMGRQRRRRFGKKRRSV